jgi:hypothetical protein
MFLSLQDSNGVSEFLQQGAWIDIRIRDTRTSVTHCYQRGSLAVVHRQPL